jgi:hypothetical protein
VQPDVSDIDDYNRQDEEVAPMHRRHRQRYVDQGRGREPQRRRFDNSNNLLEKFDGNPQQWNTWKTTFIFVSEACNWSEEEKLLMLRTHLRGTALNALQNLSEVDLHNCGRIIQALDARYGSSSESTKTRLRAELSSIKQLETEDLDTFADRVYALTLQAHMPNLDERQAQCYAVDAFLSG